MIFERAGGKLVGGHDEVLADELLLVLLEFVVTYRSADSLAHALKLRVVVSGEGAVDFELLRGQQLHFAVTLAGVFHGAVLALEVELLRAEDILQVLDQGGLARVRCSIQPD